MKTATKSTPAIRTAFLLSAFSLQALGLFFPGGALRAQTHIPGGASTYIMSGAETEFIVDAGVVIAILTTGAGNHIEDQAADAGSKTIKNYGTLGHTTATPGTNTALQGVLFQGIGARRLENYGLISMGDTPGFTATRYAVRVNVTAGAAGAEIYNSGTIQAGTHGILSNNANPLKIENLGSIIGENKGTATEDYAIYVSQAAPDISILNSGLVRGGVNGIIFYNTSYMYAENFIINNSGTIEATRTNGTLATPSLTAIGGAITIGRVGVAGGSGTIANTGLIRGAGSAIFNTGSNIVIQNTGGTIQSTSFHAIVSNVNAGQVAPFIRVDNAGGIITAAQSAINIATGSAVIMNTAGGSIIGSGGAGLDLAGANIAAFNDASQILGATYGMNITGANASVTNLNAATITGASGLWVANAASITNSAGSLINGTGLTTGDAGIRGTNTGIVTLDNSGTILGGMKGVTLGAPDGHSIINHAGGVILATQEYGAPDLSTPTSTGFTGNASGGITRFLDGAAPGAIISSTVVNAGLISGGNNGIFAASGMHVFNTGTIRATGAQIASVYFAAVNASQNSLTLGTGSVLEGDVLSAKAAGNRLFLEGSGSADNNFTGVDSTGAFDAANGFESLAMAGSAWTLSGTLSITGAAAGAITLNSGTLTLTGALLTPGNAGVSLAGGGLALDFAGDTTFGGAISGSGAFIHAGAGLLELTGANTYSGMTTITTGTLKGNIGSSALNLETLTAAYLADSAATSVTFGNITGSGVVDIQNASLVFDVQGPATIQSFNFAGTLDSNHVATNKLIKTGDGRLNLTQSLASALSGGAEIQNGVLILPDMSFIATTGLVLGGGATAGLIEYTGATPWNIDVTLAGAGGGFSVASGSRALSINVAGSGAFVKDGAGALDVRGMTFAAGVNATEVRAGSYIADETTLRGNVLLAGASATLIYEYDGASALTDSRAISGAGGLVKSGTGLLNLTGATTYSGNTIVQSGILQGNIGTGGLQVDAGATYKVADGATTFQLAGISGNGSVDLNAASLILDVAAGSTSVFNFTGNLISSNTSSKLVKTGGGTTSLLSPVVLQGGVEVQDGTLRLANQAFITTPIVLGSAATAGLIEYTGAAPWLHDVTLAAGGGGGFSVATGAQSLSGFAINGSGDFVKAGAGTLDITSANITDTAAGAVRVLGGTLRGNIATLKSGGISLESPSSVVEFNQAADAAYAGTITGPGTLLKTGAGALALTGANSYGDTEIREGLLSGVIGAGLLNIGVSGTYRVAAGTTEYTTAGVQGNGTLDLLGASMVFDIASGTSSYSFAGVLLGGDQLVKEGAGTLNLLNAVTLPNGAAIHEGAVRLDSQNLLGAPVVLGSDSADGFLEYTGVIPWNLDIKLAGMGGGFIINSGEATLNGPVSSTGGAPFIKDGAGTLDASGASFAGVPAVLVRGGLLRGDAAAFASMDADIDAGATFELRQNSATTYSGVTSGAGDFRKAGAGVMTVTGALGHTGWTQINQGRLVIGAAGVLPAAARVSIADGAALDIGWLRQTVASLDNSGAIYIDASVNSRAGVVHSAGYLEVTGAATGAGQILVRLNENNTYSLAYPSSMIVARVTGANDYTFGLAERAVDGPYDWTVQQAATGGNVILSKGALSPEVPAAAGIDAGAYLSGRGAINSLSSRLASHRASHGQGDKDKFQVWAQWLRHDDTLDEDLYKKTSAKTDGIQLGAEWNFAGLGAGKRDAASFDYKLVGGIHYDSTQATVSIPGGFSTSVTDSHGLGVYGSYRSGGLYVDLLFRNARNKYNGTVFYGEKSTFRTNGYSMAAAIELGGLLPLKSPWKIEPQARLTFQRHTIDPFVDGMDRRIEITSEDSREGLVAVRVFREFANAERTRVFTPHLRAGAAYESRSGARIAFVDPAAPATFVNDRDGAVAMFEGGFAYKVGFGFCLQATAAWYEGAKINGKSIYLGAAFAW